ncbi:MAG: hypothetical protein ACD_40C00288G0001 [uncultured bacterium]|nr:MAG: hypothetical protein ACD_40C00288G0001 [uncultured bacterium]
MTEQDKGLLTLYESWLRRTEGGEILVDSDAIPEAGRSALDNYMDARSNRGVESTQAEKFRLEFLSLTGFDPKPFMSYFVSARKMASK